MISASKRARPVSVDISTSQDSLTQALTNSSKKPRRGLDKGANDSSKDSSGIHSSLPQETSPSVNSEALINSAKETRTQPILTDASKVNGSTAKKSSLLLSMAILLQNRVSSIAKDFDPSTRTLRTRMRTKSQLVTLTLCRTGSTFTVPRTLLGCERCSSCRRISESRI